MSNFKNLNDQKLREYCKELGVDSSGPRETILLRVRQHIKFSKHPQNQQQVIKKRKKKSKQIVVPNQHLIQSDQSDGYVGTDIHVEIVPEKMELELDSSFAQFAKVFDNFQMRSQRRTYQEEKAEKDDDKLKMAVDESSDDEDYEDRIASKKKQRKLNRVSVAVLKQLVKRPETVEWVDVTAADPFLLVTLKATRNSVPVPMHWSQKRKFLQGKRGAEKIPYELPDYIKDTGIMQLREATATGNRNKYQAKMGKLDIDYQKLHDAFFKYQTKPHFTVHGEIYYEGKEFEAKMKSRTPGQLSDDLTIALNIPHLAPPPWLINMQRYGPPPSYFQLILGTLN